MAEYRMDFLNPVFHDGMNVTVRDGDKWAEKLKVGDELALAETGANNARDGGRVVGILYCSLDELPSGILKWEHDPACRTKAGLREILDKTYGKTQFGHRMVTAVIFYRAIETKR